ncbi:hypothetical protein BGX34_011811, partial [Mortierella sp. NVP85]
NPQRRPVDTELNKNAKEPEAETSSKRHRVSFTSTTTSTSTSADSLFSETGSDTTSGTTMYVTNILAGKGRHDSEFTTDWTHKDLSIATDLMAFREKVIKNNFGISYPHEMLADNFIFIMESENQSWGLQGEIPDET